MSDRFGFTSLLVFCAALGPPFVASDGIADIDFRDSDRTGRLLLLTLVGSLTTGLAVSTANAANSCLSSCSNSSRSESGVLSGPAAVVAAVGDVGIAGPASAVVCASAVTSVSVTMSSNVIAFIVIPVSPGCKTLGDRYLHHGHMYTLLLARARAP